MRPAARAATVSLAALVEFDVADGVDLFSQGNIIDGPSLDASQNDAVGRKLHAVDDAGRQRGGMRIALFAFGKRHVTDGAGLLVVIADD